MVYSPAGSTDLLLILSCMTCNRFTWPFPLCVLVFMRRTDTIVCAKLNKPPSQISSPSLFKAPPRPSSNVFERNNPPPPPPIEDLQYIHLNLLRLFMNQVRSLLNMRCLLLGYSLEPRPNSHALGTAGSGMIIGLFINGCSDSENQFDGREQDWLVLKFGFLSQLELFTYIDH